LVKKEVKLVYNKIKRNLSKNKEIIDINSSIFDVKKHLDTNLSNVEVIKNAVNFIHRKGRNDSSDAPMEELLNSLPAENLRELEGDFSKKLTFKDVHSLCKMRKEYDNLIENRDSLIRKEKILNIELLQTKIKLLLNE